ncbi:MAG: nitrous oxide reductase accessory protein NosL [Deltaproteobacteria bacterium]|nr:nitrous oxide reductase accessory protein NosL [Deltaproteobacteria bacterium]MBW2359359.1 nitrous oxide reductase accessory protein NosL [Deltaproteobacteria bacterium]
MAIAPRRGSVTVALALLALLGCGPADDADTVPPHQAVALADQEDEVCGMLVRAQSAPRSQVVHRDGSRFFFCSFGDMLVHLGAPSPHGRAETVFVEVMEAGEDPMQSHTGEHPWVPAEDAVYVVGIERPGIMGEPVLAYAERSEAESVMQGHSSARMLDMAGLRDWWKARQTAR